MGRITDCRIGLLFRLALATPSYRPTRWLSDATTSQRKGGRQLAFTQYFPRQLHVSLFTRSAWTKACGMVSDTDKP